MLVSDLFDSNLKCALSVQAHLRHGDQHLLIDEFCLPLCLDLFTLSYQLEEGVEERRLINCQGGVMTTCRSNITSAKRLTKLRVVAFTYTIFDRSLN